MTAMRPAATLVTLLLLATCVTAGEEPEGAATLALEGAPATVAQPSAAWTKRAQAPAPGQWFAEFRGPEDALLRVHVFPALQAAAPEKVLVQAVDTFFRSLGVQGFGLPTRKTLELWGWTAAEGNMLAMWAGTRVKGRARLVRVSAHQWAIALGIAPTRAKVQVHDAVVRWVRSLEPDVPRFYERRFHRPVQHEVVVVRRPEEEPVTVGHLASVQVLLEAGIGSRFPLALWPQVRGALQADAERGPPRTRTGFRESSEVLQQALALEPEKRGPTLRAMGKRILDAILARAKEGYAPAVRIAFAWREMRQLSLGEAEDGLTTGALAHLVEMSEFLASIAADAEVRADVEVRKRLHARLAKRWPELAAEERKRLRASGETWAALRYAWDNATVKRRLAFRVVAAARLTPGSGDPEVDRTSPDARVLKRWLDGRPREGLSAALLDAAFDLDMAARQRLIDVLRVDDADDLHVGW